jgi:hypothetical protein
MEAYLEAIDVGVCRVTTQGFPNPKDPKLLVGDEANYEKWNAKAKNALFRDLCKEVFNHVVDTRSGKWVNRKRTVVNVAFIRSILGIVISTRNEK